MKKALFILITFIFIHTSFSQKIEWNEKFMLKSTQNYLNNFVTQPIRSTIIEEEFGFSGLYFETKEGEFHTVQIPEFERNYGFFSYGNRKVKGWLIEGQFRYQNQKQDSVGWKQTRDVNESPFYYANIRKGNWRNERFSSFVNASKYFLEEKLGVGIGVDYRLETHSRGNDPRPLINFYQINPKLQFAYKLTDNHQVAIGGNYLKAIERGNVSNFNQSNDSFGRTEYNIYTYMGGASFNLIRRNGYESIDGGYGFSGGYYYIGEKLLVSNEFDYSINNKKFYRRGIEGSDRIFENIGDFDTEIIKNKIFVEHQDSRKLIQAFADVSISQGTDFNYLLAGNNYQQDDLKARLNLLYSFKNLNNLSIFGEVGYFQHSQRDFNASHAFEITNVSYSLGLQKPTKISDKLTLYPQLSIAQRLNLDQSINILSSQINLVSTSVLIPNIDFLSADYFNVNAEFGARIKFKKFDLNPVVFADFNNFTAAGEFNSAYFESRGSQRNTLGFSINFIH
ncbi:hypothetical protein MM213_10075 [Belliella sp. R4-6]|uniref:DUF6850 domain-containing protein n=1 Tax=Belliella alkalica TaxID=1730871 RepID=A0ABS9VBL3_9BACT|nr:DUF6850 family outer membrane beta-barrel protein [Belliella alkalica]MCH7413832.1 hypothetical protein [Belliella alkalica]